MRQLAVCIGRGGLLLICTWLLAGAARAQGDMSLSVLAKNTHFHGISVDSRDGMRFFLATHHGVFLVDSRGNARRVSDNSNDYMGFTPHPSDPDVLYASGHPVGGGNLGFITSTDGGRTWAQVSRGAEGPVDFHQMDVSKADPSRVYGSFKGLQISGDAGRTWRIAAPLPDGLIDLAASAVHPDRLYAATKGGLLYSTDAGQSWQPAHLRKSPATMVQTGFVGELYAFVLGVGLLRTREPDLRWESVNNGFDRSYLLHLTVDPAEPRRLYAVTNDSAVVTSRDGGATWAPVGGPASE